MAERSRALAVALSLAWLSPLPAQEDSGLREEIEVGRVVVDVRALDRHANPIPGLGRDDFVVEVDGDAVRVESVEWITGANARFPSAVPGVPAGEGRPGVPFPGRLIVMFFQRHTLPTRIVGLIHGLRRAEEFLDSLGPEDRVAILVLDSHLEVYSDFTEDREALRDILRGRVVPSRPPPDPAVATHPSLARHLRAEDARRASTPEAALLVAARALGFLEGSKSLLFFGWGLGFQSGGAVQMRPEYGAARRALMDARVAVFSLDVTRADYHTLEGPLTQVARDTGGYYIKTFYSSYFAMDSVARLLAGRYELVFEKPALPPGEHVIRVRLREPRRYPGSQVLYRESYGS